MVSSLGTPTGSPSEYSGGLLTRGVHFREEGGGTFFWDHPDLTQPASPFMQEIQGEPPELLSQPASGGQECDRFTDGLQPWCVPGRDDWLWDAPPNPLMPPLPTYPLVDVNI